MAKKKPDPKSTVEAALIPEIDIRLVNISCLGTTPIIVHQFPKKTVTALVDKHTKNPKAAQGRAIKDPIADFLASVHRLPSRVPGQLGPHAIMGGAFKAAAIDAIAALGDKTTLSMKAAKQMFHVVPHLIQLHGDDPVMCEHVVRNQTGVVDVRHRAIMLRWSCIVPVRFAADSITPAQILNLLRRAGFGCGVGEWRPSAPKSKNGQLGLFDIVDPTDKSILVGKPHTDWCRKNPVDPAEAETWGVVPADRLGVFQQLHDDLVANEGRRGKSAAEAAEAAEAADDEDELDDVDFGDEGDDEEEAAPRRKRAPKKAAARGRRSANTLDGEVDDDTADMIRDNAYRGSRGRADVNGDEEA